MATLKAYPNGGSMGRGNNAPIGGRRGTVNGWSRASVRRHKAWLFSVVTDELDGDGYGVSLPLRETPQTHIAWAALVARLHRAFRDAGVLRWHWVVEWQRRGTPHLHLAVYAPDGWEPPIMHSVGSWTVAVWLRLAGEYGAAHIGQQVVPITGAEGWLKYLSKHASRGVAHYQRQGMPAGWESSGRLWGHGGSWPTAEPVQAVLDDPAFRRLRRLVRSYVVAEARSAALAARPGSSEAARAWARVSWARRMLRCTDPGLSAVRGFSEWVPGPVLIQLAVLAGWSGELKPVQVEGVAA